MAVRLPPTVALATLMQQVKGGTAHAWNHEPETRGFVTRFGDWFPLQWQDGYWAESCTPRTIEPLLEYIRDQRVSHSLASPFEGWRITTEWAGP